METKANTNKAGTNFEHFDAAGTVKSGIKGGLNNRAADERLLNIKDVADRLKISIRSVWRLVARGELPSPMKIGRKILRFSSFELDNYIEHLKQERKEI